MHTRIRSRADDLRGVPAFRTGRRDLDTEDTTLEIAEKPDVDRNSLACTRVHTLLLRTGHTTDGISRSQLRQTTHFQTKRREEESSYYSALDFFSD